MIEQGKKTHLSQESVWKKEIHSKKMKSMGNDTNTNSNNWLGFSLSPQTHPSSSSVTTSLPTSFFHSSAQFNYSGVPYGVESENGGFYSPLTVMPLKSDGSLCIMEALTRSHPQGQLKNCPPLLPCFFLVFMFLCLSLWTHLFFFGLFLL